MYVFLYPFNPGFGDEVEKNYFSYSSYLYFVYL